MQCERVSVSEKWLFAVKTLSEMLMYISFWKTVEAEVELQHFLLWCCFGSFKEEKFSFNNSMRDWYLAHCT